MGFKRYRKKASNYFKRVESNMEQTWENYKQPLAQVGAGLLSMFGPVGVVGGEMLKASAAAYDQRKAMKGMKKGGNLFSSPLSRGPFNAMRGAGEGSVDFHSSGAGGPGVTER